MSELLPDPTKFNGGSWSGGRVIRRGPSGVCIDRGLDVELREAVSPQTPGIKFEGEGQLLIGNAYVQPAVYHGSLPIPVHILAWFLLMIRLTLTIP